MRRPHPPRLDACVVTGLWAERGGGVGVYRQLQENMFTGPLPTELGAMDVIGGGGRMCVHHPHPPCLDACAVTGLWAVGAQSSDSGDGGRW